MNCIYCNLPCLQFSPTSIGHRCSPCQASFYFFNKKLNSVDLEYKDKNRTYMVNLLFYSQTSVVSYTTLNNNIVILAETKSILNITPQNIKDKMKLYMVFS
jgi:hypothetical protein